MNLHFGYNYTIKSILFTWAPSHPSAAKKPSRTNNVCPVLPNRQFTTQKLESAISEKARQTLFPWTPPSSIWPSLQRKTHCKSPKKSSSTISSSLLRRGRSRKCSHKKWPARTSRYWAFSEKELSAMFSWWLWSRSSLKMREVCLWPWRRSPNLS